MYTILIYKASDEEKKRQLREDIVRMNTKDLVSRSPVYYIEATCSLCCKGNDRYYAHFESEICQDDIKWCHRCVTKYNNSCEPKMAFFIDDQ